MAYCLLPFTCTLGLFGLVGQERIGAKWEVLTKGHPVMKASFAAVLGILVPDPWFLTRPTVSRRATMPAWVPVQKLPSWEVMTLPKMVLVSKGCPHPSQGLCRVFVLFVQVSSKRVYYAASVCAHACPTVCCPTGSSVRGFSRQEHWSGLPFPPPRDLPNPGIKPASPALAGRFFTTWATREVPHK